MSTLRSRYVIAAGYLRAPLSETKKPALRRGQFSTEPRERIGYGVGATIRASEMHPLLIHNRRQRANGGPGT